ncbi:enoyl-CoA hydratase/isomerase family protein [Aeromicrobium sp. CTD01-1L150]|uniref:enoyl-CoA hydratase/isomerase family protein n=1 Tax=Aeromicrobium sp. CTD01-1L150 TaxID=3341830 RepID=UPI0035C0F13A
MSTSTSNESDLTIAVEHREKVLWVDLQRPDVLNAINRAMVDDLHRMVDRAEQSDVRAVVIRGTGRAFCAGADLHQVPGQQIDIDLLRETVDEVAKVIDRIASLPKPVIAGVHGVAAAGGLEIVLACDIVVATRDARFADAHSNYGLLPGGRGSVRLPRLVGAALAKRLMFTGEFVTPSELVASGLVAAVVEPEELDDHLHRLAGHLTERSPRVLAAMKRLVDGSHQLSATESADAEEAALGEYLRTPDLKEGLTAFREGRQPRFDD